MSNAFGVVLGDASVRRAVIEGVSETVIAAIYLLHDRSADEVAAKLRPEELGHVIRLVGRCPSCYPSGTLDALRQEGGVGDAHGRKPPAERQGQGRGWRSSASPTRTATRPDSPDQKWDPEFHEGRDERSEHNQGSEFGERADATGSGRYALQLHDWLLGSWKCIRSKLLG